MKTMSFLRGTAGTLLLAVLGLAALSSCSRKVPTPLDSPQPTLAAATVSSLTFSWKAVTNAVEYTYELCDAADDKVESGSTKALVITFTGLTENTTYTFKLTANCDESDGDHEMSKTATVSGTTAKIQPLKAPVPVAKFEKGVVTVTWEAIENADSYSYFYGIVDSENMITGTTNETSLSIEDLELGSYGFAIQATSADEAYSDSEYGKCEFTVEAVEMWSKEGFFFDGAGKYWRANLVAMSDGSYSLKNWYNIEGYDLNFTVNEEDGAMQITNYTEGSDESYFYVNAGLENPVCLYPVGGYSNFGGDASGGEFYVYSFYTNAYAYFQWPAPEGAAVTADEIAGTYAQNSNYWYYGSSWEAYSSDNDVTIKKVDDTTITISNLIWSDGGDITATLDPSTGIITVAPQDYYGWVFAGFSETLPVIGAYKDGVIGLNYWNLWYKYDGYDYYSCYTSGALTTLTKK